MLPLASLVMCREGIAQLAHGPSIIVLMAFYQRKDCGEDYIITIGHRLSQSSTEGLFVKY